MAKRSHTKWRGPKRKSPSLAVPFDWLPPAEERDEGPSDRCDIDPIAALREDDSMDDLFNDAADMAKGKKRERRRGRKGIDYSAAAGELPAWMMSARELPKKPPGSGSGRKS